MGRKKGPSDSTKVRYEKVIVFYENVLKTYGEFATSIKKYQAYMDTAIAMNNEYEWTTIRNIVCKHLRNGQGRINNKGK